MKRVRAFRLTRILAGPDGTRDLCVPRAVRQGLICIKGAGAFRSRLGPASPTMALLSTQCGINRYTSIDAGVLTEGRREGIGQGVMIPGILKLAYKLLVNDHEQLRWRLPHSRAARAAMVVPLRPAGWPMSLYQCQPRRLADGTEPVACQLSSALRRQISGVLAARGASAEKR